MTHSASKDVPLGVSVGPRPTDTLQGPQIAICLDRNVRNTFGMSQLAHAKALNLLADVGVDPDDARYVMKRLHDYGYAVVERDPAPGGSSPPGHGKVTRTERRQSYMTQMRAEVTEAREAAEAERQAGLAAEAEARAAEDAARQRQLAVARVLADLPG